MVSIKILEKKNEKHAKYRISNVNLALINSIRRVILSEIPNIGFAFNPYNPEKNDIDIITNTSALNNEFLGHRLSMIPIYMDIPDIEDFEKCKDYTYVINVKNDTNKILNVTSGDIKVYDENNDIVRHDFFPRNPITNDHILINKLKSDNYNTKNGEEMYVEMKATIDIAKTHARWSPVSTCAFMNTIDEKRAKDRLTELLENIPPENTTEIKRVKNHFNSIEKYRMFCVDKYNEPNSFDFEIESECKMTPKYLLLKAIEILINKFRHIVSEPNKYTIDLVDGGDKSIYCITFKNETHTFANLFQSIVYDMYCIKSNTVNYIGYFLPHPLEERIVFKFIFNEKMVSIEAFIKTCINKIVDYLNEIQEDFKDLI